MRAWHWAPVNGSAPNHCVLPSACSHARPLPSARLQRTALLLPAPALPGVLKSTYHRVRAPREGDPLHARYSIPYFFK